MAQRGFAGVSGTIFTLNDQPFYFAGANNYYLIYKSEFMINSVLDVALAMGLKVIRTWAFLDRGSLDGSVPDVDPPGALVHHKTPRLGIIARRGARRGGDQSFERTCHASLHSKSPSQVPAFDALPRVAVAPT